MVIGKFHAPPEYFDSILYWYTHSRLDYSTAYLQLYIAYNGWYQEVTGTSNDRQALGLLKKRSVIWADYQKGLTLKPLRMYMEKLVDLTNHEPLGGTLYWEGYIQSATDWRSLIEYWYQIRCLTVHGGKVDSRHTYLAYETLSIFMSEIISRVQKKLNESVDYMHEDTFQNLSSQLQAKLYKRYLASPDIWQVDIQSPY